MDNRWKSFLEQLGKFEERFKEASRNSSPVTETDLGSAEQTRNEANLGPVQRTARNQEFGQEVEEVHHGPLEEFLEEFLNEWVTEIHQNEVNSFLSRMGFPSLPSFSGVKPVDWINGIEVYFDVYPSMNIYQFSLVEDLLVGKAKEWATSWSFDGNYDDYWNEFADALCEHFENEEQLDDVESSVVENLCDREGENQVGLEENSVLGCVVKVHETGSIQGGLDDSEPLLDGSLNGNMKVSVTVALDVIESKRTMINIEDIWNNWDFDDVVQQEKADYVVVTVLEGGTNNELDSEIALKKSVLVMLANDSSNGDELEKVEITGLDMNEPGYVIESGRSFETNLSSRRCVSNGTVVVDIDSEMKLSISSSSLYELTGIMILVYDPGKWMKRIVKLGMDLSAANLKFYAFLQVCAFRIWDPGDFDVTNKLTNASVKMNLKNVNVPKMPGGGAASLLVRAGINCGLGLYATIEAKQVAAQEAERKKFIVEKAEQDKRQGFDFWKDSHMSGKWLNDVHMDIILISFYKVDDYKSTVLKLNIATVFGVSHLLEKIEFKIMTNRSHWRVVREVEAISSVVQASASREQMGYTFDALKTRVPEMVELQLVDSVRNPAFLHWEISEQIKKLEAEISEISHNPQELLLEAVHAADFFGALTNPLVAPQSALNRWNGAILEKFVAEHYTSPRIVLADNVVQWSFQICAYLVAAGEWFLRDIASAFLRCASWGYFNQVSISTAWLGRGLLCACAQRRCSDARPLFDLTPAQEESLKQLQMTSASTLILFSFRQLMDECLRHEIPQRLKQFLTQGRYRVIIKKLSYDVLVMPLRVVDFKVP